MRAHTYMQSAYRICPLTTRILQRLFQTLKNPNSQVGRLPYFMVYARATNKQPSLHPSKIKHQGARLYYLKSCPC